MVISMTGFGRAVGHWEDKTITIEIKTLNSKATDIKLWMPARYREKEMLLRKLAKESAQRGKVEISMEVVSTEGGQDYTINKALFRSYYKNLQALGDELNIPSGDYITGILRIQGVVDVPKNGIANEEWEVVRATFKEALSRLKEFRCAEGNAMEKDLRQRVISISDLLTQVAPYEQARTLKTRERILSLLENNVGKENVDLNRFEQELLYYLEKMDINEEKVRLSQHCKYFLEQLDVPKEQKGRKLTFIGQEMGREINTLGSKAYSSDIQHLVVRMKDELEKIKEQAANIL